MSTNFLSEFVSNFKKKLKISAQKRELKKSKLLIQEGNYDEALRKIEELENREDLDEIVRIGSQITKVIAFVRKGDNEKALELIERVLEDLKEHDMPLLMIDVTVAKAEALSEIGKFNESFDTVLECENLLKMVDQSKIEDLAEKKAILNLLKGTVYRRKRELDLAMGSLQKSLSLNEKIGNLAGKADVLNQIGLIHASKGEFDQALKYLQQSLEMFEELGKTRLTIKLVNNIGLILNYKGELDQALDYYKRGLDLSEKLGSQTREDKLLAATLLANIGLIYMNMGELDEALDYNKKSLVLYEELESKNEIATCHNNIGIIFLEKGELDEALDYHERSLALVEELGDKHQTAIGYNNIGNNYQYRGDVEKAASYFEKSLNLLEEIGYNLDTSVTLQNLVRLTIFSGSLERSQQYFDKLEKIREKEENKLIDQVYRLAKAHLLRTSDRMVKRAEAQQLFQQISDEDIVLHEYTVEAMINLCDMLLIELRSSGDEEVLEEIKSLLERLLTVARNQNSYKLLAETYMVQAKMALVDLDTDSSRQLLEQAQKIAEEKGLQRLAIMISGEYDTLLNQLSQWNKLIDRNVSLIERLEMAELENMVSRMVRKKEEIMELPEEEPALFLILSKKGTIQFSKQFLSEKVLNDQVVSDLLTAINSFIQETFAATGSIERVKHKDHTLIMKPIEESLLGCYAFKGHSYSALHKIEKFIEIAKRNENIWRIIENASVTGESIAEEKAVDDLVTEVFLSAPSQII